MSMCTTEIERWTIKGVVIYRDGKPCFWLEPAPKGYEMITFEERDALTVTVCRLLNSQESRGNK